MIVQNLRLAVRIQAKWLHSTLIVVLVLAFSMGANTAIFSAVNGILLAPLPYADSPRLVKIESRMHHSNSVDSIQGLSLPALQDVQTQCPAFEELATFTAYTGSRIQGDVVPDLVDAPKVSGAFFSVLGVRPLLGRIILPSDVQPGSERVAVLNYSLWKEGLGSDPHVLGRSITIDDQLHQIIGVMPQDFVLGTHTRGLWVPFVPSSRETVDRNVRASFVIAKIKRSVSLNEANSQLSTLAARLAVAYPDKERGWNLAARSVKEELVGNFRTGLLLLFGAALSVAMIAGLNTTGLLLTRGWARQREIAIREALGAGRLRIGQQFLAEGLLLAFAGGTIGLVISVWAIHVLRVVLPSNIPRLDNLKLDPNVLAFTLGLSILEGILFGLVPATQVFGPRINTVLKDLSASPLRFSARHPVSLRSMLVVLQVAVAVVLVIGAMLLGRSFEKLLNVNLGYRTDHVLTMSVLFSQSICDYGKPARCQLALEEILQGLRTLPGVDSVAATSLSPLRGEMVTDTIYIEGQTQGQNIALGSFVQYRSITSDFFRVMRIPMLRGRAFTRSDAKDSPSVCIVNRLFSQQYFSGDSIGKRMAIAKDRSGVPQWMRIVGEVDDSRDVDLKAKPKPQLYVPIPQMDFFGGGVVIRTTENPLAIASPVRQRIRSVDKAAPILGFKTMDQVVADKVSEPRFQMILLGTFAALALGLAVVGVYGVIATAVNQRTREIGVRATLGAQPRDIVRMVIREGMRLALVGIAIGICGSLVLTRFLKSLLFEINSTDPSTFASVAILFALVALAACWIPARRAMRVDPMVALRYE